MKKEFTKFSVVIFGKEDEKRSPAKGGISLSFNDDTPVVIFGKEGLKGKVFTYAELKKDALYAWAKEAGAKEAYIGPCLNFANTPATEEEIQELFDLGYGDATKRSNGVDYSDRPFLAFLQLRKAGLKPDMVHISALDTKDAPILYSAANEEKESNKLIAELL